MTNIRLTAASCTIDLDTSNPDWAKCFLYKENTAIYLGAESPEYLKTHLLAALRAEPGSSDNKIECKYSWALSLAEAHHVLYTALRGDTRIFMWQDEKANEICMIELSNREWHQWLSQIEAME